MKTTGTKSIVNSNNVLSKKNESGLKRKSRWERNTGGISRKDLNSLKYYSICNSNAPDEQIVNIDGEKPNDKDSELKNLTDARSTLSRDALSRDARTQDEQIIIKNNNEKIENKESGLKRKTRWDLTPKGFLSNHYHK